MSFGIISFLKRATAQRGAAPVADDNPLPASPSKVITKGTIALGQTTYGVVNVGGLTTVATGLPAGSVIKLNALVFETDQAHVTTPQGQNAIIFDANPAASTTTDNAAFVLNVADIAKVARQVTAVAPTNIANGLTSWLAVTPAAPIEITLDASGNFYILLNNTTASLVVVAGVSLNYRAEYEL